MQCTSYNPVYYHPRDLNNGGSGLSWNLFHNNANYGKETGYNLSLPMSTTGQFLAHDKEVLRQIIQNHEATFRHQVQELHRLYRRQTELTDEMRVREIFRQQLKSESSESSHLLSRAISATAPHTTSWLLGDHSRIKLSVQSPAFVAKNFRVPTNLSNDPLTRKSIYNELESISSRSGGPEKRILDLEPPANMYGDDEFEKKEIQPASNSDAEPGSNLNSMKANVLIDLNEPVQLESMASSSETCPMEVTIHNDLHPLCGPGNKNLPVAIDLNSMPLGCYSERETTIGNCTDDDKYLKVQTPIDLNTGIFTDEPSPPPSCTPTTGIRDLAGPTSPDNKERLPPRGKSEDSIQLETPLDIIGAETLLTLSSSEKFMQSLCWFADIVSSTGDDLENEITKLNSQSTGSDRNDGNTRKGHARAMRQPLVATPLTNLQSVERFLKAGQPKRNTGKKACAKKPRKNSKLSRAVVAKKSTSSFRKQPGSCSKNGDLLSWGLTRQRQGGRKRRASKSFSVIS